MAEVIAGIPELIERGKKFTYENFSSKSDYGYPNAYSDEWLVWTHSVIGIAAQIGQSPIGNSIARGLGIEMIGNDQEKFESAKALIVSGLQAAQRVFGEAIQPRTEPFLLATIPRSGRRP